MPIDESSSSRDLACAAARGIVRAAQQRVAPKPTVAGFFDEASSTVTYVVRDPTSNRCGIVDSVLNFDAASGCSSTIAVQTLIDYLDHEDLVVEWLLETHVHADHISAATFLKTNRGGRIAIGDGIQQVQSEFGKFFNEGNDFRRDGSQFDHLFADGEIFSIGGMQAMALHVPGHTPACVAYVIGDAVFAGDTLFMPDYGTARCDFPGGEARQLYRSIRRLTSLPGDTRLFVCHDYKAPGRNHYAWETSVYAQRTGNVHVHEGVSEETFVNMRNSRDATLSVPGLLLPSVQVNMRAGRFPRQESNGISYLKLPINAFGAR